MIAPSAGTLRVDDTKESLSRAINYKFKVIIL